MNTRINAEPPQKLSRYLATLEAALVDAPANARSEILEDVLAHASDALAEDRTIEQVLEALGPAEEYAAQYRNELGLPEDLPPDARRSSVLLHGATVAVGVLTGSFVAFALPNSAQPYLIAEMIRNSMPGDPPLPLQQTLLAQYGPGMALLAFMPALLAVLPLVLPQKARMPVAVANAVAVGVFAAISFNSIGIFYVPLAVLMWAAVVVPWRVAHGLDIARSPLWRIFGAVLLALPGMLLMGGMITETILPEMSAVLTVAAILVLSVLFAFGLRAAFYLIAAIGFAVMALAMLSPGLLAIAFWWSGGAYLAIGLSAVATLRPRNFGVEV